MLYDSDVIVSLAMDVLKKRFVVAVYAVVCCILKKHRSLPRSLSGVATPNAASDLLALLMSACDPESGEGTPVPEAQRSGMTDRQLRDEMMTVLIAGHEARASALAWTWYLLATDPAAEAKLHAELAAVLGGRMPQVDDLADLRYTQAVFEEALWLYPPAWIITRENVGRR